ncbi:reticulocyte-binding protein 2 a [Diplogelasinospora grovesii]|uniref:Reticulocyte-binding protein 2 a n=1 Tax=Diplogelasinospora grovesii TaxID=303347 RepID=A0AAN6N6A6_9PEZI|nr:reticulocyte-binding protein 2 a [Diplogelasinospora grovesii]
MAAHHEPFKALGPVDWVSLDCNNNTSSSSSSPNDDDDDTSKLLAELLDNTFSEAQVLIDSVPAPSSVVAVSHDDNKKGGRPRSHTTDSAALSQNINNLSALSNPDHHKSHGHHHKTIQLLAKEWKEVKVNPKDNPLGISVYKLAAKDGKGSWFARRSFHEGVTFDKFRIGLEREFVQTLKNTQKEGVEPGKGNIRGIGAERKVESLVVEGKGKVQVLQVSARFGGPTTPRDFITLGETKEEGGKEEKKKKKVRGPRQFMLVSKPCVHPECPQRNGFIRGQYESVEIIREVAVSKPLRRTRSSIDFSREDVKREVQNGNIDNTAKEAMLRVARQAAEESSNSGDSEGGDGKKKTTFASSASDIGAAATNGADLDDEQPVEMAIEWLMVTRSDPGGSVPRFMVEKGTPGGIIGDADKFLKWLSSKSMDDLLAIGSEPSTTTEVVKEEADGEQPTTVTQQQEKAAAIRTDSERTQTQQSYDNEEEEAQPSGFYGMIAGAIGAAGSAVASRIAAFTEPAARDTDSELDTLDDESDTSSDGYVSAEEGDDLSQSVPTTVDDNNTKGGGNDGDGALSTRSRSMTTLSNESSSAATTTTTAHAHKKETHHEKELRKLEERRRKAQEKIEKMQERAAAKQKNAALDGDKDAKELAKLRERHEKEIAKQEEKYQRDLKKLEEKRAAEEKKAEEKRRKQVEREEKMKIQMELDKVRAERDVALKQIEMLKETVGELQAQNTQLVAKLGKIIVEGERGG